MKTRKMRQPGRVEIIMEVIPSAGAAGGQRQQLLQGPRCATSDFGTARPYDRIALQLSEVWNEVPEGMM